MRQRHGKHTLALERLLEHGAVAGLENVERKQRLRKENGVGERHDPYFLRQFHITNIACVVPRPN